MVDRDDGEGRRGGTDGGLTRGERTLLGRLAGYLGFADFVAVMMVIATALSAFATWRTATIADEIYRSSERPYFGVEKVYMDWVQPGDPRIVVQYQNFGHVPADDTVVEELVNLDGRPVPSAELRHEAGIISPGVPHQIHVHLPAADRESVTAGKARLTVDVKASYRDSSLRTHCYLERFVYYPDSDRFDVGGGSPRCDQDQG